MLGSLFGSRVISIALSGVLHLALVGSVLALVPAARLPRVIEVLPVDLMPAETPPPAPAPPPKPAVPKPLALPKPVKTPLPEPAATPPPPAPAPEARQPDPAPVPQLAAAAPASAAPAAAPGPPPERSRTVAIEAPPGPGGDLPASRSTPPPVVATRTSPEPMRLAQPRGGYQVKPSYPASARRLGVEGTSMLRVYVAADGRVTDVKVDQSAGHPDLDSAAVDAVRRWQFEPGRRGEEAVGMWVQLPVRFVLR